MLGLVPLPQLTYNNYDVVNNPTGGPQTLTFVFPPISKPRFNKQATRTDTFSTAGNRQTVVERVNESYPITMSNILDGDDSDAWQLFLDWAVLGGQFEYYPDADDEEEHYTCFLLETTAQLAYVSAGIFSFTGTFQKEIT